MRTIGLSIAAALSFVNPSVAGPNAGGVLLLHCDPQPIDCQEYSCYTHGLTNCADAVARIDGAQPHYWWVLAAFPDGSLPRLKGLTFGVQYEAAVSLLSSSPCADFELPLSGWPNSGTGTALTWNTPQSALLTPVYLFSGYNYYAPAPATFTLVSHPTQGGFFADDSVPALLDPIYDFGALGFSTDGHLACPAPLPPGGACCFADGSCVRLDVDSCIAQGGSFRGDGVACDPNPCAAPRWACCLPDGSCVDLTAAECASHQNAIYFEGQLCGDDPCAAVHGACCTPDAYCIVTLPTVCEQIHGTFHGGGSSCGPSPCPPPPVGACCFESGECRRLAAAECSAQSGNYLGDDTVCDPNPCEQSPTGACCFRTGACGILTEYLCNTTGNLFMGPGTTCDPYPCPYGACCLPDGNCEIAEEYICASAGGSFLGLGTSCSPSPCPPGACCLDDGSCQLVTADRCYLQGGDFHPEATTCDPGPCPPGGACCLGDGACLVRTEAICHALDGLWIGEGSDCVPSPCGDLEGACCLGDGSCVDVLESECYAQGGLYHGPLTECTSTACQGPIGCGSAGALVWTPRNRALVTDLGGGAGRLEGAFESTRDGCDLILQNSDGTYENGGAFRNQAIAPPYYGAWAECYHGSYEVCSALFDFTQTMSQYGQRMDVYVWDDEGGCPGRVICLRANVDPGPIAEWPQVSRHSIDLGGCCTPDDWWVGYWPDWPGVTNGWYTMFDTNPNSHGCPYTCIAPGLFSLEGWQNASVVWGPMSALGISAGVRACAANLGACCLPDGSCTVTEESQCAGQFQGIGTLCDPNRCGGPVPIKRTTWGRVKALYH